MRPLAYTRFELVRTFRNWRLLLFSLGFPLILFFVIAAPNRHEGNLSGTGISLPLYHMVGLVSFGAMMALISSGARIARAHRRLDAPAGDHAADRGPYFRAKVLTGYAMAIATIGLLYASGIAIGVSLPAGRWLEMTGLILIALVPFAALGILLGHLLTADSIGPATGGIVSLLALLSGTWFPFGSHGLMHDIAQFLPS